MRAPTSEKDIRELLADRPARTRTYPVSREVLGRIPVDKKVRLRSMSKAEVQELADYLGARVDELDGPFKVVRANCPHCERLITFLDFVQTGVKKRAHTKAALRDILTGRAGAWITIRGADGGRPVLCARCGESARMANDYSEYSSSSYAYA